MTKGRRHTGKGGGGGKGQRARERGLRCDGQCLLTRWGGDADGKHGAMKADAN